MKLVLSGNEAAAYGARLARTEVISAYPITPQTKIVEKLADFVARDEMDPEFIKVESEHSAMAACISASLVGARTFTATSSQGLLLMHEMLHWASGSRTPIVMVNINRAVAPPWSVWADQTDSVSQRDTGWIQYYCESCQEVVDTLIQAYKVCEHESVRMPAMLSEDAFYLSHTSEPVDLPDQEMVDEFLGTYEPEHTLDVDDPRSFGSLTMPHQWYFEFRYKMAEGMERARSRIIDVDEEFGRVFGRSYGGMLELYRCDDAETVIVAAGSMSSTIREAVDRYREEGKKIGLARLRVFRPFPRDELRALASRVSRLIVLDRSFCFGNEGAFHNEIKAALFDLDDRPEVQGYVIGIGGRDVTLETIDTVVTKSETSPPTYVLDSWIGLRRCEQ
jgi:2-oxoisovalerate ferredoxin oxidoreductase alpha subunit